MGNLYNSPFEAQFDPDRAQAFIIMKLLRGVHTCGLVRVLEVQPTSGKVGFVKVQPLVQDVDTNGVVLPQTPIYNVPYFRYQAGTSAVIMDPAINDIGLAMFAENDITNVKQTLAQGAPATARVYNTGDALYIGGVLNPDPTQWIKFQPGGAGIDIVSPGEVTLQAGSTVTVTAPGGVTFKVGPETFTLASSGVTSTLPITAPDFIAPNANLNIHQHAVSGATTIGTPHN